MVQSLPTLQDFVNVCKNKKICDGHFEGPDETVCPLTHYHRTIDPTWNTEKNFLISVPFVEGFWIGFDGYSFSASTASNVEDLEYEKYGYDIGRKLREMWLAGELNGP